MTSNLRYQDKGRIESSGETHSPFLSHHFLSDLKMAQCKLPAGVEFPLRPWWGTGLHSDAGGLCSSWKLWSIRVYSSSWTKICLPAMPFIVCPHYWSNSKKSGGCSPLFCAAAGWRELWCPLSLLVSETVVPLSPKVSTGGIVLGLPSLIHRMIWRH